MARVRGKLRCGFSTGTAGTAAARAALRHLITGEASPCVAVRLPMGFFLPVLISGSHLTDEGAWASVIKDGGDDPDVTHHAEIQALVKRLPVNCVKMQTKASLIRLVAGDGVGVVTKPGLPVGIGEPAVNPVPRMMLVENLTEELLQWDLEKLCLAESANCCVAPEKPHVFLPFSRYADLPDEVMLEVEIRAPRGQELARHTLNPRLGIIGGISILGTTGIVRPFSHEAYKETIQAELSVAASNGCNAIVLSTGGKSERFARRLLKNWPEEAFIQIADFFAFALEEARQKGFEGVVLSVFFGKAVKMAQGHPYTHAHTVPLDLAPLAGQARAAGYPPAFCAELAGANTAREALDLLLANRADDLVRTVVRGVLEQSSRIIGSSMTVRLFLFDYEGSLLLDLEGP
jgi:cobalt-precorrin-5B (C1)-methyltransferase